MKKIAWVLGCLLLLALPLTAQAINLGGITINLPGSGGIKGGGSSSSATQVKAPELSDHPTKIEAIMATDIRTATPNSAYAANRLIMCF